LNNIQERPLIARARRKDRVIMGWKKDDKGTYLTSLLETN
jgi:hypothetical protein